MQSRILLSPLHPCSGRSASASSTLVMHERAGSPMRSTSPVPAKRAHVPQAPPTLKTLESGVRVLHYVPPSGVAPKGLVVICPGAPGTPMGPGGPAAVGARHKPTAVFSASATTIFSVLARRLSDEGYCVSHFAWRAASPGGTTKRTPSRLRDCTEDVLTCARSLRLAHDRASASGAPLPLVLLAHSSEGCAAAMAAACLSLSGAKDRDLGPLAGVVACASGLRVDDNRFHFGGCDTLGCLATFARFGMPLMLMHGLEDGIIEAESTALIYESARGPKACCLLRGCDHTMATRFDDALSVLLMWVPGLHKRYGVLGDSRGALRCTEADQELGLGQSVLL